MTIFLQKKKKEFSFFLKIPIKKGQKNILLLHILFSIFHFVFFLRNKKDKSWVKKLSLYYPSSIAGLQPLIIAI
jgi:hypothetical protein